MAMEYTKEYKDLRDEEARELVGLGQGEPKNIDIEYSADEDSNNWTVEEIGE